MDGDYQLIMEVGSLYDRDGYKFSAMGFRFYGGENGFWKVIST